METGQNQIDMVTVFSVGFVMVVYVLSQFFFCDYVFNSIAENPVRKSEAL